MKEFIRGDKKFYLGCLLIAIAVTLLFVSSSSPLYSIYYSVYGNNDVSALFVAGRPGSVLYRDLFVSGGPVFYYLIIFFYHIGGKNGVFIFDIILLFFTLSAVYRFSSQHISKIKSFLITVFTVIPYIATVAAGNTAGSLVLLYSLIFLLYAQKIQKRYRISDGLVSGLLVGLCIMTSFSAGAFLYGLFVYVTGVMIRRKNRKETCRYLLTAVLGILICVVPFAIYFGCHNALGSFAAGTFRFDLYFDLSDTATVIHKIVKVFPAAVVFVLSMAKPGGSRNIMFAVCGIFATVFSLAGALDWYTYLPMIICVPVSFVLLKPYKKLLIRRGLTIILILAYLAFYFLPVKNYVEFLTAADIETDQQLISDLNNYYENTDNHTLLLMNMPAYYYLETDTTPQFKYFYNQSVFAQIDGSIQEEINSYITGESTNAIIIARSTGYLNVQVGDYYLADMYYKGRTTYAVYEYVAGSGQE